MMFCCFIFTVLGIELRAFVPSYIPGPVHFLRQNLTNLLSCPRWAQTYDLPAPASQSDGVTGMGHDPQLYHTMIFNIICFSNNYFGSV